jgi:hypothetical protein
MWAGTVVEAKLEKEKPKLLQHMLETKGGGLVPLDVGRERLQCPELLFSPEIIRIGEAGERKGEPRGPVMMRGVMHMEAA